MSVDLIINQQGKSNFYLIGPISPAIANFSTSQQLSTFKLLRLSNPVTQATAAFSNLSGQQVRESGLFNLKICLYIQSFSVRTGL